MEEINKIRQKRQYRFILKKYLRKVFIYFQKYKVLLLPYHFYIQIPNISFLKKEQYWRLPFKMDNINGVSIDSQLDNIKNDIDEDLIANLPNMNIHADACLENGDDGYAKIDAQFLYAFIKKNKPKRVIQIGCGVSTAIVLRAMNDANIHIDITCIEPYPSEFLKNANKDGKINLVEEFAQKVSIDLFKTLTDGDLLFVDSTHTVMVGSEVNRIILEILPVLNKGVTVHFHDIWFPYDYSRIILTEDIYFWGETTLLHSFLSFNSKYKLYISLSYLHYYAKEEMKKLFLNYNPQSNDTGLMNSSDVGKDYPTACYIKVIA